MSEAFEGWAIVELMGHRRLAGKVSEVTQYGKAMLRLDVFGTTAPDVGITQFYGPDALYCVTPTTEEIARRLGEQSTPAPVQRFTDRPGDAAVFNDRLSVAKALGRHWAMGDCKVEEVPAAERRGKA